MEDYRKKLINELALHNARIESIRLLNNKFSFKVSCEGMNINKIYPKLDNVYIEFVCSNILKLNFDFKESIIIDKLIIESDDDKYIIKTNDLDIICSNLNISFKPLKMLEKHSKLLDSILFSN
jgi:hypothetical protein